jgi:formylglycine-generating enzyme
MHRFLRIFLLTSTLTITLILSISYSLAFQKSDGDDTAIPDAETSALIPGGVYTISDGDEMKTVELNPFYIDIFEVTNKKYAQFLNDVFPDAKDDWLLWVNTEKGSQFKITFENGDVGVFSVVEGYEDYPVVTVSWEGAMAYAEWAGKTLPTMEQWEVAARGNSKDRFPWGDELDIDKANYHSKIVKVSSEEAQKDDDEVKSKLMPAGSFDPNEFGLYDVIGNAWEWTSDDYKSNFLSFVPFIDSLAFLTKPMKVMMGGSFLTSEEEIGVSLSFPANIKARFGNIGFRCVTPADPATIDGGAD